MPCSGRPRDAQLNATSPPGRVSRIMVASESAQCGSCSKHSPEMAASNGVSEVYSCPNETTSTPGPSVRSTPTYSALPANRLRIVPFTS